MSLRSNLVFWIGTLKHLTNTFKKVKNEYVYGVPSLKSLTLPDKLEHLHNFFSKDLAEVYVTDYNYLKFITQRMAASVYSPWNKLILYTYYTLS